MNPSRHSIQALLAAVVLALVAACAATPTRESTGEYIDDTTLTTKVKAALLDDPQVSGLSINVETFKGTVQLSGFANNDAERRKAVELARAIKGVDTVKNDILLK
jgi:hyperosmotically inducible protein